MAKVKLNKISKKERYKMIGEFFDVIVSLRTKKETIDFFVGMMTPSEALMFSRRMQVAKYLLEGETYESIRKNLGVGYGTISQVERWLYERDEAYKNILKKYSNNKNKKVSGNSSHKYFKNKLDQYPGHKLAKQLLGLDYFD